MAPHQKFISKEENTHKLKKNINQEAVMSLHTTHPAF